MYASISCMYWTLRIYNIHQQILSPPNEKPKPAVYFFYFKRRIWVAHNCVLDVPCRRLLIYGPRPPWQRSLGDLNIVLFSPFKQRRCFVAHEPHSATRLDYENLLPCTATANHVSFEPSYSGWEKLRPGTVCLTRIVDRNFELHAIGGPEV